MIGERLSHFKITALLGEGGMGEVYLAEDTKLHRQVALKVLPKALTDDAAAKERFLQEALAASSLDHANVCTVYEVGETGAGQMFLAMAYYGGQSLKQRLAAGPMEIDEAIEIAAQVARGLARAHAAGIVHRDIKPANIMLTEHGEAKIVDFGLAKLTEAARLTQPGTTLGTPAYMSPEQVQGQELDGRSDVWSLAVVLYEMLTGQLPFRGGNESAIIYSILNEQPRPAERNGEPLHQGLRQLLDRALSKNAEERYPSASELAGDLEALLRNSSERTLTMIMPKVESRGLRGKLLWLGLVAVLVAGLGYLTWRSTSNREPESPQVAAVASTDEAIAVLPFTVRGNANYQYLSEGMVDLLGTKFDGAGNIRSVDSHAILSYVNQNLTHPASRAEARRLAEDFGASFYLLGEILEAGGQLHISASLYRSDDAEAISKATVEGPANEIFELLDSLTSELLAGRVTGAAGGLTRTAALTTESLPALKLYLQAESQLRAGQFSSALESFQQAVEIDPDFALAWYRMSVAAEWSSVGTEVVQESASQAVRLSDRLSERYRQLLEARLAAHRGATDEAESRYRAILGTHPEDVEAWTQLGEILSHRVFSSGRSSTESREAWEKILELDPNSVSAMWHLARVAALENRSEELQALGRRILELSPEGDRVLEIEALIAYKTGDEEAQQKVLAGLRHATDTVVALTAWSLAITGDRPNAIMEVAEVLTEPSRSKGVRAQGYSMLAYTQLSRGRWQDAKDSLRKAESYSRAFALEHSSFLSTLPFIAATEPEWIESHAALETWDTSQTPPVEINSNFFNAHDRYHEQFRLYLTALLEAHLGDVGCLETADRLSALSGSEDQLDLARELAAAARARWWWLQGNSERALDELGSITFTGIDYQDAYGSPLLSHAAERFLKAQIFLRQGHFEQALPLLDSFSETSYFEEAFVAPASFYKGEVFEALGRPEEARRQYELVVDLWQDCQPPLCSWVDQARVRIAALSGPS